jgi:hypothetical protein
LYQAKRAVRVVLSGAAWARAACSRGRNTLTSPLDGLRVPTTATTRIGQKRSRPAKPSPVASMSKAVPISSRRSSNRCAARPTAMVREAEPSRVPATMAPTCAVLKPSRVR